MNERTEQMNPAHAAPYGEVQNKGVIDWSESEEAAEARMAKVRETYGELIAKVPADKHADLAAKFFVDHNISGDSIIESSEPQIIWSDVNAEQAASRANREPAEVEIIELTDNTMRQMRGRTKFITTCDTVGFLAEDSKWGGGPLDEKTKAYYATFQPEKIEGLQQLAGAMREAEKRVSHEPEFDAEAALDRLEEFETFGLDKESEAEFLNQREIAAGRAPVYSATMLSALDAAERRKQQKRRKKSKRK